MQIFTPNEPARYETLKNIERQLKEGFKVKGKGGEDTKTTEVPAKTIRYFKNRKETTKATPLFPENNAENNTETDTAPQDAQSTYEKITAGLSKPDKPDNSVKESADLISKRRNNLIWGAKKIVSIFAQTAACMVVCNPVPLLGSLLLAEAFYKKDTDNPSLLSKMCNRIDNVIGKELSDQAYEDAHKVVAEAFTDNKETITEALKKDKAAILDVKPDSFILDTLDNIYEKELDKEKKKLTDENSPKTPTTKLEELQAKRAQEDINEEAKEKAEDIAKEKRLLTVRALTEKTDLVEVLKNPIKIERIKGNNETIIKKIDKTNLDQFLDLEPAQMRQVIEAFHLKRFDLEAEDPAKLGNAETLKKNKQSKFTKAMELVQDPIDSKDAHNDTADEAPLIATEQSDEKTEKKNADKIANGKNALGHKLWQHEKAGVLRIAGMAQRKIGEKIKDVGKKLRQWAPQIKTAGLISITAAGHYMANKHIEGGDHFKPTTSYI